MKKIIALLLAVMMTAALLAACNVPQEPDVVPSPTAEPEPTADPFVDVMRDDPIDAPYAAKFTVSKVFSNNMVVQRGEFIRVWGWADESENGKKVSGEFLGMFTEALVENGEWVLTFKARLSANAETGNDMRIYTDTDEVVFEDVLVGDVYMVIGQSNTAYSMSDHWNYVDKDDEERCGRNTFDPTLPIRLNLRTFTSPTGLKRGTEEVNKDIRGKNSWRDAKKTTASSFSALGYLFAMNYVRLTGGKVPVGMIEIDGNGLPLGAFVPNEIAERFNTDKYDAKEGIYKTTGVNAGAGRFIYNEYMYPFERMAIAGILWYQGESDLLDANANVYPEIFTAYVEYMRGTHNLVRRDFPVYFMEFPSEYQKPAGFSGTWHFMDFGKIRGEMGSMVTMAPNMYQVQSSDVWNDREFFNNLHPNCKYEQALRAAKIACAVNGEEGFALENASGPIVESVTYSKDGKVATVKYKNVGDGLKTTDGGDTVRGFRYLTAPHTIGGEAHAKITGRDTVEVEAEFTSLAGVAYNVITWNYFGDEINLCNSAGIPAGAFLLNRP